MKKRTIGLMLLALIMVAQISFGQSNDEYTQRFIKLYQKINDQKNGYFSKDGVPYHSVESLMCEAPDHGHETTSEMYSYWIWLEVMNAKVTGNWSKVKSTWDKMEATAIPTTDLQPTAGSYNPSSPATFAGEHPLPEGYPSPLEPGVPVGKDPISGELTSTYGNSYVYGMHWLFDLDNFYGYGNKGDGVSTPSYINTFQRGDQESVWETVPHPSWESFKWGADDGTGFLRLFIKEENAPAAQWRYTNAPDADARVLQAIYWATEFAKEQGVNPGDVIPLEKAKKMGDYLRLAMFDKYFKPMGVQDKMGPGGQGYESAHYLISWYYAWGGPLESQGWAWRIGCSHNHFGYQNPVAAYALSNVSELIPNSPNAGRDWGTSLDRQLEFYQWLQSAEGAIAGGATNSWNGQYEQYPAGTPTFYKMGYDDQPVYHDPGSNTWFGMQAWSMERVAEYYYITNNARVKKILDKWVNWVMGEIELTADGTFKIPVKIGWEGKPFTWDPNNPKENTDLHVTVEDYNQDIGIASCLAKALIYYAAATGKHGTLDTTVRNMSKELLDRIWKFYDEDGIGIAVEEKRGDYNRFFEQEVYIPEGWTGKMANGDIIKPGVKFIDIRSNYKNDPDYPALKDAYDSGQDYATKYHRFWAQVDAAMANAEYARFFVTSDTIRVTGVTIEPESVTLRVGATKQLVATVLPANATNKAVSWVAGNNSITNVDENGLVTAISNGETIIIVTTTDGGFKDTCKVTVTSVPTYTLTTSVSGNGTVNLSPAGGVYNEGDQVTLTAVADQGWVFKNWSGDATGTTATVTITMDSDKSVTANFTEATGPCDNPAPITLTFRFDGAGQYCWVTSDNISFVNSWNLNKLEINGVDYTNKWSNQMPAKIDGNYYFSYSGMFAWSHFEAAGTGNRAKSEELALSSQMPGLNGLSVYPNPLRQEELVIAGDENIIHSTMKILDASGKQVLLKKITSVKTIISASNFTKGIYFIEVVNNNACETIKLIVE